MLGRADGVLKIFSAGEPIPSILIISVRTRGVAVAVTAVIGTDGSFRAVLNQESSLYAGRKS